jgi:hypothetical protein
VAAYLAKQVQEQRKPTIGTSSPVNEAIERIVLKALAKRRERRYQNAAELGREIANYLAGQPTTGPHAASRLRAAPVLSGQLAAALICLVVALLTGVWVVFTVNHGAKSPAVGLPVHAEPQRLDPVRMSGSPRQVELIGLVRMRNSSGSEEWSFKRDTLVIAPARGGRVVWFEFPYAPPEEYDYRVTFKSPLGGRGAAFLCANRRGQFELHLWDRSSAFAGFDAVSARFSSTARPYDQAILNGKAETLVIKVRQDGVEGYLNDNLVNSIKTDFANMRGVGGGPGGHGNSIGIGVWDDELAVHGAEIVEITGQGRSLDIQSLPTEVANPENKREVKVRPNPATLDVATANPPKMNPPTAKLPIGPPVDAALYLGSYYKVFLREVSWTDAEGRCKEMGGRLACPQSATDLAFLGQLKGEEMTAWVGGFGDERGNWTWVDGKPILSTLFDGRSQPDGYRWLFIARNGKLSARPESGKVEGAAVPMVQGFICEWDK